VGSDHALDLRVESAQITGWQPLGRPDRPPSV